MAIVQTASACSQPRVVTIHGLARAFRNIAPGAAACWALATIGYGIFLYGFGWDSHAYWVAWHRGSIYLGAPEQRDAFLYSPAFAQAIWPLAQFQWPMFAAIWAVGNAALFAWLLWPMTLKWRLVAMTLTGIEVVNGNVWALTAVVLVLGFARPGFWAFPLLTKITSAVGLVWFAARREWQQLITAIATALFVIAISAATAPGLWHDWLAFLLHGGGRGSSFALNGRFVPPIVRLPIAVALAIVGARKSRPTWLAWAVLLGSPVFALESFAVLAALPRLRRLTPLD
jgi:hypothetical protein